MKVFRDSKCRGESLGYLLHSSVNVMTSIAQLVINL
jgi:hypothetical protein